MYVVTMLFYFSVGVGELVLGLRNFSFFFYLGGKMIIDIEKKQKTERLYLLL